jgi:hypothetical protein
MLESFKKLSIAEEDPSKPQNDREFITHFLSKMDGEIDSFGKIMLKINQEFYRSENCSIDLTKTSDFSTIASKESQREDLAKATYLFAFQTWLQNGKKEDFQYAEIGAGNGDFSLAMFELREELKTSKNEDLRAFSHSLKFNICDFDNMHQMQREKLGENSKEFTFHSVDLSCDQIPKCDFIFGNEIPDTQRVDFITIRDGVGYFVGAEKFDNKIKTEKQIDVEDFIKLKEIFNLSGEDGLYPIQTGNILFFHNLSNATDNYFMSDYFCEDISVDNYLRIYSKNIPKEVNLLQSYTSDTIEYLNTCKDFTDFFDITYSPLVTKKFLQDFSSLFFQFGRSELEQGILKLSQEGKPILPSEFIDICSSNLPEGLQDSVYLRTIVDINTAETVVKDGDENVKSLPLTLRDGLEFKDRFLNNAKVLKILLESNIIDADNYDGSSRIIFDLLDKNKIDQAKLLIEHSRQLLISAKRDNKDLLEYSLEKFPESADLHKLIKEKFEKIKVTKPSSTVEGPSKNVDGATNSRQ